jgi:hypothetical protein
MNAERSDVDRALRIWFEEGPTVMNDHVVELVADRVARQPQRRTWRLRGRSFMNTNLKLVVAAALAVAVGVTAWNVLSDISGPGGRPTPLAPSSPSVPPAESAGPARMNQGGLAPRTYVADVQGEPVSWTLTVPAGWSAAGTAISAGEGFAGPTGIGIAATGGVNVPSDPCDAVGEESDGQSVADVVAALEAGDDLVVSGVVETTLGGYSGTRVDVEMPADLSACDDLYILFAEPDGSGFYAQGPSNLLRIWILDVEGRPIAVWIESFAGTPASDLGEAQRIVDSIVITP